MKITFRQIEAFQAVVATGSVTEAAKTLGVSQPAVSRRLADFESQLGFSLFHRVGRSVLPTAEARLLIESVRRAFGGLDRIREAAESIRDFQESRLTLVTTPSFAASVLPDLVAAYVRRRPQASISLDVQSTDDAVEWLTSEAYDFGFACDLSANPRLDNRPLISGAAVCMVPLGHPLAEKSQITVADLKGESVIGYRADSKFRNQLETLFVKADISVVNRYEARTSEIMVRLIERGLGIGIIGTARVDDFRFEKCKVLPFKPHIGYTLKMIWSNRRERTAVAADFATMIDEMFGAEGLGADTNIAELSSSISAPDT